MSAAQPAPKPASGHRPVFHESGASWYWLLTGPVIAAALLMIQATSGYGYQPLVPTMILVLVSGFIGLQVKAARIHASVELTEDTLRQGTETIKVADIVKVYPERRYPDGEGEKWRSARALGELTGVPRGRVGIGIRLTGGRNAQAWARRHRRLRAVLTPIVGERTGRSGPVIDADDADSRPAT